MSKDWLTNNTTVSSYWTPESDTSLLGWYDPSDLTTVTPASGGPVITLADKSPRGYDMEQTVVAQRPESGSRTLNNLNVIACSSTDSQHLENTDGFTIGSNGNISIFMVAEIDSINNTTDSVFSINAEADDFQFQSNNATQFNGSLSVADPGENLTLLDGPYAGPSIYNAVFDWATRHEYTVYMDGTQDSAGSQDYQKRIATCDQFRLFCNRPVNTSPDGAFGEVVVTSDVSDGKRQKIEGYLAHKWGLAGNLDIGHPYKASPPLIIRDNVLQENRYVLAR